jgi:iron complex outermembrane recepter protein
MAMTIAWGLMMKISNSFAALAASTALATLAIPAFAQSAQLGSAPAAPANETASNATADDAAEIIVTSNKRAERLQDVPISVGVVTAKQLSNQNIIEVADLTRSTPALNSAGPYGALSIRGVGSISFARSAEGSVGVVVDGVALANTSTNPPQLFDVARVEVLEGPQGTLFGRNSSAGVVNVTTNAPDFNKLEVIAHADVATRNNYVGRAVVNIPISSTAALRVAGSLTQAPENQYNRYDDSFYRVQGASGRARLLWDAADDVTVNLIADYSKFTRSGGVPWTVYQSSPTSLLTARLKACGVDVGPENQQGCIDGGNDTTTESYGFSGQVDFRLGDLTLTSISAYRVASSKDYGSDADSVPVDRLNVNASPTTTRNFSQEFRLTSPSTGLLTYVVGAYVFGSELSSTNTQAGNILADLPLIGACPFSALGLPAAYCLLPVGQIQTTHSSTTSQAVFGNLTINATPQLRFLLGARYGNEDVSAHTTAMLIPGALTGILSTASINGAVSDTYFSPRLGVQYDVTRDVMVYATYTRGYKGPSVNDQTGTGTVPVIVEPEIPHASEIGVKANMFDGRLTASLAGYYNRIDNFQAQFFDPTAAAFIFGNAPELTTKGVSFSVIGRPLKDLTLNGGVLYNNAKYGDGYLVACAQGQTAAQGCMTLPSGAKVDDAGGNRLVGAPLWKLNGFAEYAPSLGGNLRGVLQADVVYTSRINFDAAYSPQNQNAPAAIFGARIGVRTEDDGYGVAIFARNLFDTYRPVVRFATPTALQQLDPLSFSQISGPESRRVVGVSFDARF